MLANQARQNINPLYTLYRPSHKGLNLYQKRNKFYNRYPKGPTKIANPDFDYVQATKDFFGPKGKQWFKDEATRIIKNQFRFYAPRTPRPWAPTRIFEHFDSDENINKWQAVADSSTLNGYSTSSVTRSLSGHALFKGVIDTRVPDDGATMKSGFAALIGPRRPIDGLLKRDNHWDWTLYNTFEIRFRGDGRRYGICLNTGTYHSDLQFYDNHYYPLYTRGGPYWQTLRVPFTKFIFASESFVQDQQCKFPAHHVKFVSITLNDNISGPFELEIDYVGIRYEIRPFHELKAYEDYAHPHSRYRHLDVGCDPPDSR